MKPNYVLLLKYILKEYLPMPSHATEDKRITKALTVNERNFKTVRGWYNQLHA